MDRFPWRLVTFDIDGTLTVGHGWRFIAEHTGQLRRFEATDTRYQAGQVGEDAHLRALLDLAVGRSVAEIEALLEKTPKIGHIRETVVALHRRGARVALLSHNPEYVCAWYRRRFGFDDADGTRGTRLREGRILPYGRIHAAKVAGMRALRARAEVPPRAAVHIGDSRADARVFPHVGGGVALNARLASVRSAGDAALATRDLRDVVGLLERVQPHPPTS